MAIIKGGNVIQGVGLGTPILYPGIPTNGTNEVQTIAITGAPTGGTFKLTFNGSTTTAIPYNATAAQVTSALEALPTIGAGNVTGAGGALPGTSVAITFAGQLARLAVSLITAGSSLSGGATPSVDVTRTTAGVNGTARSAPHGALLNDTTNGDLYQNKGTPPTQGWTLIGA